MSQYKELASVLVALAKQLDMDGVNVSQSLNRSAAILRSLDAQPVAEVMVMGSYRGKPILGCVLHSDSAKVGDKLYAAPVAAQPTFEKGSWQHAVDDQLVGFGRTSQEFGSPHDAVRWLIEQEVQAAQPTREQAQRERMEARQWNAKAFNFPEYFAALQRAMQARNATPADVSRATGVSATTLTRMKEGRRPDAASLAALSAWAGLNPAAYVKASPATADFDLPAQSDEVAAQPQQIYGWVGSAFPVFVNPISAQPQQAKPLSDAEIEEMCPKFEDPMRREMWIIGFKAAHGIKEQG